MNYSQIAMNISQQTIIFSHQIMNNSHNGNGRSGFFSYSGKRKTINELFPNNNEYFPTNNEFFPSNHEYFPMITEYFLYSNEYLPFDNDFFPK
jgi:hypothetical protein